MKNSSPFPMKSKFVFLGSLVLLAAGIYVGGVQNLTEEQEQIELAMIIGGTVFVLLLVGIGINELMDLCSGARKCGR